MKQDVAIAIVETDEGITGYGEAKGMPAVMRALIDEVLGTTLIGQDPTRVEYLWERMYSGSRIELALRHGRPYHRAGNRAETLHAISGIDVALWDITARGLNVPIYRLLGGGVRDRLPAYASGGWAPPEKTADEVQGYVAKGFRAVKIRVGGVADPSDFGRSIKRLAYCPGGDWARRPIHDGRTRRAERRPGHQDRPGSAQTDLTWFEEPVLAADDLHGWPRCGARCRCRWRAGESETTRFAFRDMIAANAIDILQPDVAIVAVD